MSIKNVTLGNAYKYKTYDNGITYITKVNAISMSCGDPANFSHRISPEKKQVVVGETDKYEALCRICYFNMMEGDK